MEIGRLADRLADRLAGRMARLAWTSPRIQIRTVGLDIHQHTWEKG